MTPGLAPHPLLARLADPAPIAWTTLEVRHIPTAQGAVAEADLAALGQPWLLRWTPGPSPTLLLHRAGRPTAPPRTRALLLTLPPRPEDWPAETVPAVLEAAQ